MLEKLNELKHLSPEEFDAELGKVLKASAEARRAALPAAKPKKKAKPKKASAKAKK